VPENERTEERLTREEAEVMEEAARLEAELKAAQEELGQFKEKYLRLLADFDNYRKRTAAELEAARREGRLEVLRALLPVLDDLERALAHAEAEPGAILEGVRKIKDAFLRTLAGLGVEEVPGQGEPFHPAYHEAIGVVEGEEDGRVAEVYQKGYRVGEFLIRPARVAVTKKEEGGRGRGVG